MDVMSLAIIVLITGIVVVFAVLLILSILIKGYGGLINTFSKQQPRPRPKVMPNYLKVSKPQSTNIIDPKVVAVISAAVYEFYNNDSNRYKILDIEEEINTDSQWKYAGVLQNTSPFRS